MTPYVRRALQGLSLSVLLACSASLRAQYDNGSLVGTIRDPTGAPIAHATVKIVNTATNIATETTTNDSGDYDVTTLRVGTYNIDAAAPGFSDALAQNIAVSVGGRLRIDLALTIGSTTTSVEVSGVDLQIETETSERGQTITNHPSDALPLVSRN